MEFGTTPRYYRTKRLYISYKYIIGEDNVEPSLSFKLASHSMRDHALTTRPSTLQKFGIKSWVFDLRDFTCLMHACLSSLGHPSWADRGDLPQVLGKILYLDIFLKCFVRFSGHELRGSYWKKYPGTTLAYQYLPPVRSPAPEPCRMAVIRP